MTLRAIEPDVYPWFDYRGDTFCLGLTEGDEAWTSGQSASVLDRESGRRVIEGDMEAQARLSYTKLLAVLEEAGHAPSDVVHITENVTAAGIEHYASARAVREEIFGSGPAVTTVVVDRLVRSAALIELELHATPGGGTQRGPASLPGTLTPSPAREDGHGTLHLPTLLPLDPDGAVVHTDDPLAQYRHCIALAKDALAQAGLEPMDVIAFHVYTTDALVGRFEEMAEHRRAEFGEKTVGGGVVMKRLHLDGVHVAVDIIASRRPRQIVDPGWGADTAGQPAVRVGDVLYCSAISVGTGDLSQQGLAVYGRLVELLRFAGLRPADLRSTIEFCAADQIGEYKVVAPIRASHLSPPWPASTGDLCTRFATDGALLQTVAIAHY